MTARSTLSIGVTTGGALKYRGQRPTWRVTGDYWGPRMTGTQTKRPMKRPTSSSTWSTSSGRRPIGQRHADCQQRCVLITIGDRRNQGAWRPVGQRFRCRWRPHLGAARPHHQSPQRRSGGSPRWVFRLLSSGRVRGKGHVLLHDHRWCHQGNRNGDNHHRRVAGESRPATSAVQQGSAAHATGNQSAMAWPIS